MKAEHTKASQLIVDLYGYRAEIIDDEKAIKNVIRQICSRIGADIVQECCHKFQPIGISAVAVITTSHISIHTWPEYGYAAADIFSCQEKLPEEIGALLAEALGAQQVEKRLIERALCREEEIHG